jgi:hypothetical protein
MQELKIAACALAVYIYQVKALDPENETNL